MIDPLDVRSMTFTPDEIDVWLNHHASANSQAPLRVHGALNHLRQLFTFTDWKETAYTAKHNEIVRVDPGVSGAFTVTLPAIIQGFASWVGFKRWTSGTNVLTIARTGADFINTGGNSSIEFNDVAGGLLLVNGGEASSGWYEWLKWDGT